MAREKWRIEGLDSTQPLFDHTIVVLGSNEVQEILRRLTCTALTPREIMDASTGKNSFLKVSPFKGGFQCGENPFFFAKRIPTN